VPGKAFDALIVDHHAKNGPYDVFGGDSDLEKFEKFIFLGDDRNIVQVYVAGKKVIDA
jgi:guanine deaminase